MDASLKRMAVDTEDLESLSTQWALTISQLFEGVVIDEESYGLKSLSNLRRWIKDTTSAKPEIEYIKIH